MPTTNKKPTDKKLKRKKSKIQLKKERQEIYSFIRNLYYFLRHHSDKIDFKKLSGGVYGYYDEEVDEITIDYRRDIIATLIHESLHHFHHDWSETNVGREESRIMNILTPKQIKNIIKIMGKNL